MRWQERRRQAARRYGAEKMNLLPAVLGNAMPKSGSHLIIQVLQGLTSLGPFVNPGFPPVNRSESNTKLSEQAILANIERMHPGDISYGYLNAEEPFLSTLTRAGRATIFVYRDPRDMIISHIFYATEMHEGHWMHRYYTEQLHTMEERINAAIQGVNEPGSELTPIRQRYEGYLGWLFHPTVVSTAAVLSLRFEDLILERQVTLGRLLDFLGTRGFRLGDFHPEMSQAQAIATLDQSIAPRKSGTFRKGRPGNWRDYFTEANIKLFKETTGDLLIQLGYAKDDDW
jgi:hypothetical protein